MSVDTPQWYVLQRGHAAIVERLGKRRFQLFFFSVQIKDKQEA